ncbi:MAG: glycosyltransferase family 4 protein [Bacteroidetes bacterium]|nr:glycosyltransferase family 4 protein [Bacteroidota bacterium]
MKHKILFIINFPPPIHGSSMVGKYIKDSKIINQEYNCKYINLNISTSVDKIGKTSFRKLLRYISIFFNTFFQLIVFRPNLCYLSITVSKGGFYKDVPIVLLSKILCSKVVYHLHNKGVKANQEKRLNNLLYKVVFKKSLVILLSELLFSDIERYVIRDQVYICPNGIHDITQEIVPKNNNRLVQVLFLSNLIESKGVYLLLRAFSELKKTNVPFRGIFVGGEGDITHIQFQQKLKELDLEKDVLYLGKKYGNEKNRVFQETDIFAFPTYNDTFGLVNLEAMQHSLPVVSTKEGGIPDVVEHGKTGFLIDKNDHEALAMKIKQLIEDESLRKRMGKLGRLKYENSFTLEVFENKIVEILNNIIKG